jgi:hypothetical protein
MKTKTLTIILMSGVLILAGCSASNAKPVSGIVALSNDQVGTRAPDLPFVLESGKQKTLYEISKPVAIIVFAEHGKISGDYIRPELISLAEKLRYAPITVAQVSLHADDIVCDKTHHLNETRVVLLCDEQEIAWKLYRQPKANSVYLLDQKGEIQLIDSIDNLDTVAQRAKVLGDYAQTEYEEMYYGG